MQNILFLGASGCKKVGKLAKYVFAFWVSESNICCFLIKKQNMIEIIEDASGDAPPPPSLGEDLTYVVVPLRKAVE